MERSGLFPSHQYACRKVVSTCDALLDIVCASQGELDGGSEIAVVQLDFSAAFNRVSHCGLLFKLRDAGIGGLILAVVGDFLSERTQVVKLDNVRSSVVNVISVSVLGPLLFLFYIRDHPPLLENVLVRFQYVRFQDSVTK